MINGYVSENRVTSTSQEAFTLYEKSRFGEKIGTKVEYAPVEALFLVNAKKMSVFSGKKELGEGELIKRLKKGDKRIEVKLVVFSDLRRRGYIVKTALKFGADFRVYDKGIKPSEEHARWILYAVRESEQLRWHDFSAKNRIAHSTKKNLLIGVLDDEGDVTYYEVKWERP